MYLELAFLGRLQVYRLGMYGSTRRRFSSFEEEKKSEIEVDRVGSVERREIICTKDEKFLPKGRGREGVSKKRILKR